MTPKICLIKNNRPFASAVGKRHREFFGVLIILFALSGFTPAQNVAEQNLQKNSNYKIGVGDVLKILVVKQAVLSVDDVRVGNEGTIRMPMIDKDIPAACLTETELSAEITERYRKYILNPQIYVSVKEFNANPIAFVGAVVKPGRFQMQRPMRLLELLTLVNGPAANAGKDVQIIRAANANLCKNKTIKNTNSIEIDESQQEIITLPLEKVLNGDELANQYVQSGDIIRVPEAEILQAFVVGNVKTGATINLKEPVTLSKAIAMAGGVTPDANIEKIKILRQQPDRLSKTEIIANLKDINKHSQDDILLEPNDIVDVPGPSGSRKLIKDIFRAVIPAVTRLPIIVP